MESERLQLLLDETKWETYLKPLTAYAHSLMVKRIWRGEVSGPLPGGVEAVDIAMEAILDVYTRQRRWDPEQQPELLKHLFGVVQSKISNRNASLQNRSEKRSSEEDDYQETSGAFCTVERVEDSDFVLGFVEFLEDEPDLQAVVECIIDGYIERTDIADQLKIPPSEVTNRRKRLGRKLRSYITRTGLIKSPPS